MLRCVSCGDEFSSEIGRHLCECGEPLELGTFKGKIRSGKTIWHKYRDLLPGVWKRKFSLLEGDTPLIKAETLSKRFDFDIFLKNETVNPTWSFKDRGTVMSIGKASEHGIDKIGTVSTGNMGVSLAAYGGRANLDTYVLVEENISNEKLSQIDVYSPNILRVSGDYGRLFYESLKVSRAEPSIYFSNSNSPYRVEGYKTIAFEISDEIVPDYIMIPTSSGGLFRGVMKGFKELEISGLIENIPTPVVIQAEGCSPIFRAFNSGEKKIKRWEKPDTIAAAIANPYPPGGNEVLRKLKEFGGSCFAVSDKEILRAQKKIASEGIHCQHASSVGVAALEKLEEYDAIEESSTVMTIITGSGFKYKDKTVLEDIHEVDMEKLERFFKKDLGGKNGQTF